MKNRKLQLAAGLAVVLTIAAFVITSGMKESPPINTVKPVQVLAAASEYQPVMLEYLGTVAAREMKKYGFKSGGRIEKIHAEKGGQIKEGDLLAQLETRDLELAVEAAKNTYLKSKSSYDFALEYYNNMERMHLAGAASKQETDKAKLELDIHSATLSSARADLENKENMVKDAFILSEMTGYVADTLYKAGEIVSPGYPVVVVRSKEINVKVGLSQNDVSLVKANAPVTILFDGSEYQGRVANIDSIPNPETRTYNADIEIEELALPLGLIVRANFDAGETEGIYIPINCIMNDGQDYVYVIDQENRAVKKTIKLGEIRGPMVEIKGLQECDRVVIEGMKRLKEGDNVSILP